MRVRRNLVLICFVTAFVLSILQPSVRVASGSGSVTAIADTFATTMYRPSDYHLSYEMKVGAQKRPGGTIVPSPTGDPYYDDIDAYRAFIKFDLSSLGIPTGSAIDSATLTVVLYYAPDGAARMWCDQITSDWVEQDVHWNAQPSFSYTSPGISGTTSWDVKRIVANWITYGQPNYGFVLHESNYYHLMRYYTKDNTPPYPPTLTISWHYDVVTTTSQDVSTNPVALLVNLVVTRTTEYETTTTTTMVVYSTTTTVTETL